MKTELINIFHTAKCVSVAVFAPVEVVVVASTERNDYEGFPLLCPCHGTAPAVVAAAALAHLATVLVVAAAALQFIIMQLKRSWQI